MKRLAMTHYQRILWSVHPQNHSTSIIPAPEHKASLKIPQLCVSATNSCLLHLFSSHNHTYDWNSSCISKTELYMNNPVYELNIRKILTTQRKAGRIFNQGNKTKTEKIRSPNQGGVEWVRSIPSRTITTRLVNMFHPLNIILGQLSCGWRSYSLEPKHYKNA